MREPYCHFSSEDSSLFSEGLASSPQTSLQIQPILKEREAEKRCAYWRNLRSEGETSPFKNKALQSCMYTESRYDFDLDFDVLAVSKADFETEDPVIVHEMKQKGIRVA